MSRASSLIVLGILAILIPLSGFPVHIRSLLIAFFGVCVLSIGLRMRTEQVPDARKIESEPEPTLSTASSATMSAV